MTITPLAPPDHGWIINGAIPLPVILAALAIFLLMVWWSLRKRKK
jgi:hypothetical protein